MAPSGIGENEQIIAAVIDRVLDAGLAGCDQARARRPRRIGKIDQMLLGCLVVAAGDDAEAAELALSWIMREPTGVLFLIDKPVLRLRGAHAVQVDLPGAVVGVEPDIKEAVAVLAVQTTLPSVSSTSRRGRSGFPVADADGEISEPLVSALQASSLWSGECRAPPNLKYS